VLLLLPSIASALAAAGPEPADSALAKQHLQVRDSKAEPDPAIDINAKSKYEIGTKDAPVDGKDGKPHAGPWVGTETGTKKQKTGTDDEQLVTSKSDLSSKIKTADGSKIPDSNDGVMDDPHRQAPKEGTTGTEGGVSEKSKARKTKDGQLEDKRPDSPKEAPPLPHSEEHKGRPVPVKSKEVPAEDEEVGEGLSGLEVSMFQRGRMYSNNARNQTTYHPNLTTPLIRSQSPQTKLISTSRMTKNPQHLHPLARPKMKA
jgi:hypothetical protein